MVLDILILTFFNIRTYLIYPPINPLPILYNNYKSLLLDKKSSIFKLNRLVYLPIWCNGWVITIIKMIFLSETLINKRISLGIGTRPTLDI